MTADGLNADRPLRIGLFTHSTNPRGGVVHVLELAEALGALGHSVVVHAPDESGRGFFRRVGVGQVLIPAAKVSGDLAALVRQRVGEYVNALRRREDAFDIYHAHDGISGCALADLVACGSIPAFVRTVHHADEYADPFVRAAQDRSIAEAATCLCVSEVWRQRLKMNYDVDATVVSNGVDLARFTPSGAGDAEGDGIRVALGGRALHKPIFLAVGGVERRKNTVNILRSFLRVRKEIGTGTLLIVGGASLLDHSACRRAFDDVLATAPPEAAAAVVVTGPIDDARMPAAYRSADALVFPSLVEGFGLAVLEAMACGTPVVTSARAPFTEYLTPADALLVDPEDPEAIAVGMRRSLDPSMRASLRSAGLVVSRRYPWSSSAREHERAYRRLLQLGKED